MILFLKTNSLYGKINSYNKFIKMLFYIRTYNIFVSCFL